MQWMFLPLKRYADFQGRSLRLEYWLFQLGQWILFSLLALPLVAVGRRLAFLVVAAARLARDVRPVQHPIPVSRPPC